MAAGNVVIMRFVPVWLALFGLAACTPSDAPVGDAPVSLDRAIADADAVKKAIAGGENPNKADVSGMPPVHVAVMGDKANALRALLEAGADPEATAPGGMTALMAAAGAGSLDCVKVLVAAGADVQRRSPDGFTAQQYAAAMGKNDVAEFLAAPR